MGDTDTRNDDSASSSAPTPARGIWPTMTETPDPATMSDSELNSLRRRLEQHERTVSRRRASMHNRIDFVRSGGGFGNPEAAGQLEDLQRREHEITEERRQLHEQIDALRAESSRRRNLSVG